MSRSIHTTHSTIRAAARWQYTDRPKRSALMKKLRAELRLKRQIKGQVKKERTEGSNSSFATAIDSIPVTTVDEGEFIHYPATVEDIRNIMNLLPKGILDGLSGVDLRLGTEYLSQQKDPPTPDPLIGRPSYDGFPGVYSGNILGVYFKRSAKIWLFAYIYDSTTFNEVWGIYLKLQMLSTFVHEIAHHYDHLRRVARGRWLANTKERVEMYAESKEHHWLQQYVIPYLESTYPNEVKAFCDWVAHYGGISFSLARLAGNPRVTGKGDTVNINNGVYPMSGSVEIIAGDLANGWDLAACRVDFANQLHYRDEFSEAFEILDKVLQENPNHIEALTLQADIFVHQERYDEALQIALSVTAINSDYLKVWKVLADIYEARKDWQNLLLAVERWILLDEWSDSFAIELRAKAKLELGDFAGFAEDLKELVKKQGTFGWRQKRIVELEARKAELLAQVSVG